jgi:hypothetical protein
MPKRSANWRLAALVPSLPASPLLRRKTSSSGPSSRAASRAIGVIAEWIVYLLVAVRQLPPGAGADLRSVMRISSAAITMAAARKMNDTSGETVVQRIPAIEDAIRFPIDWRAARRPSRVAGAVPQQVSPRLSGLAVPVSMGDEVLRPSAPTRSSPACTACAAPAGCSRGSRLHANTPAAAPR